MHVSLRWLHRYLEGPPLSGERAEHILMELGFPSESREPVESPLGPDERLDVEVTSNRGDCLSHLGLARELAASPASGLRLLEPTFDPAPQADTPIDSVLSLHHEVGPACPLFLAAAIEGVRVGPSPQWLSAALEAAGQRSLNNVVDVTNFLALELGTPCHAFDLAKLQGRQLRVRFAHDKEPLTTLEGKARTLRTDEVVVADASRAQSLAGVMGGASSEVTASTTDVVLEVATWDPVTVRRASRRHQLRTTASHRYERIVDPRTLEFALRRGVALIASVAGGRALRGTLSAGSAPLATLTTVRLRPARCAAILGYDLPLDTLLRHLRALGIEPAPLGRGGADLLCTIPPWRPDLTREVDLIEEVARVQGLASVPVRETVSVRVSPPQTAERARRDAAALLTGLGFFETVTFSFTTPARAKLFAPAGLVPVVMDDSRRGDEPALRTSVLTGLLECRARNQHAGVQREGGVRLFEVASAFAQRTPAGPQSSVESPRLALLLDCVPLDRSQAGRKPTLDDHRAGVRTLRGTIEALAARLAGAGKGLSRALLVTPCAEADLPNQALDPRAAATLALRSPSGELQPLGWMGLASAATLREFSLAAPVAIAELELDALLSAYPPASAVVLPPTFPAIERDVSLIVGEAVRWSDLEAALLQRREPPLEDVSFVGAFRDTSIIGKGNKSVTVRLRYRADDRTLTHDEVDAPAQRLLDRLRERIPFTIRA